MNHKLGNVLKVLRALWHSKQVGNFKSWRWKSLKFGNFQKKIKQIFKVHIIAHIIFSKCEVTLNKRNWKQLIKLNHYDSIKQWKKITESQRIKTLLPATMNCHVLFPPLIASRLQVCRKLPSLMYVFFLISLLDSHYEILYVKSFCIYSTICYLVAKPLSKKKFLCLNWKTC